MPRAQEWAPDCQRSHRQCVVRALPGTVDCEQASHSMLAAWHTRFAQAREGNIGDVLTGPDGRLDPTNATIDPIHRRGSGHLPDGVAAAATRAPSGGKCDHVPRLLNRRTELARKRYAALASCNSSYATKEPRLWPPPRGTVDLCEPIHGSSTGCRLTHTSISRLEVCFATYNPPDEPQGADRK